jgi:hypothetical protein
MPHDTNQGGSEDMYSDAAIPAQSQEPAADPESSGNVTALIPKSISPDMQPGEEMVLKVVRVHDDQYEVEYSPGPESESAEPMPDMEVPDEDEMSSMME